MCPRLPPPTALPSASLPHSLLPCSPFLLEKKKKKRPETCYNTKNFILHYCKQVCQMTKLKQFSNSLIFFIQGKTIRGLRKYSVSRAVERSSLGIWGKSKFYRMLEEATWKQVMIGQQVGNFFLRLVILIFYGKAEVEDCYWYMLVLLDRCFLSVQADIGLHL